MEIHPTVVGTITVVHFGKPNQLWNSHHYCFKFFFEPWKILLIQMKERPLLSDCYILPAIVEILPRTKVTNNWIFCWHVWACFVLLPTTTTEVIHVKIIFVDTSFGLQKPRGPVSLGNMAVLSKFEHFVEDESKFASRSVEFARPIMSPPFFGGRLWLEERPFQYAQRRDVLMEYIVHIEQFFSLDNARVNLVSQQGTCKK